MVSTKAFCVGQAKSGTASLAALLAANHRAAHEPERAQTLDMILRGSRGEISQQAFRDYLIERDRRLNLEYDIAWANQFIIGHLLAAFPEARFIVLIRDCYSWLESVVGHLISRQIPPDVRAFLDWWFQPQLHPHTRHDRALQERGLYSTAAFLSAWNRHVNNCSQSIPPQRRLILRTHELGRSHLRLADFLHIPVQGLDAGNGHLNRGTWSEGIECLLTPAFLNETVSSICGPNMSRHFPEVSSLDDARRLRSPGPQSSQPENR